MQHAGERVNRYRDDSGVRGITYTGRGFSDQHITWGDMALTTTAPAENITAKPVWYQGQWTDGGEDFWQDFSADGRLDEASIYEQVGSTWQKIRISAFFILQTKLVL